MYKITDDRQQQCLEKFFEKEKLWNPDYIIGKYIAYMVVIISLIGLVFPYQVWWQECESVYEGMKTFGLYVMVYLLGLSLYSQMFTSYNGPKKGRKLGEIVQNLPVLTVQTAIFKARKMLKICIRMTAIAAAGQTFFAIVILHTFSIGNILIPFAALYVLPAAICAVEIIVLSVLY